jgi:ABC-type multidrug transport system fused ATPase/permease subunit
MKFKNKQSTAVLFDFFKKRKFLVISVVFMFFVKSLASIIAPLFLGKLVDTFRTEKALNLDVIVKNGKEFIVIFSLLLLIQIMAGIFQAYLKKESLIHYQNFIFVKILQLPYLQLVKFRTAYLQSRWGSDSLNLASFYGDNLFEMLRSFTILLLGITAAIYISPVFSLSILVFLVVIGTPMIFITRYLIRQLKKYLEKFAHLSGKVNEIIGGIFELKIMGFMKFFKDNIKQYIKDAANYNFYLQMKGLIFLSLIISIFVFAGFFGTLIYFGYLLATNQITIGSAVAYVAISFFVMKSITSLINGVNRFNTTFASLNRTVELLNVPPAKDELSHATKYPGKIETIKNIELKNICFKYEMMKDYVLRNFSYTFEKGKVYALKGKSGIGKSTLIKILMGVIPAEQGTIFINGKSLDEYTIPALWKKLGYLSQDPFLFKGNLKENLVPGNGNRFGLEEDDMTIKKALEDSGLDQMQIDLSQDIEVEEGGKNFSGGEKRRISLARVFIKDPDVLILDEPTSQVDRVTEEIILNSIVSFARSGKIVIIIAHSELALQKADEEINLATFNGLVEVGEEVNLVNIRECKELKKAV